MKHLKLISVVLALVLVCAGVFAFTSGAEGNTGNDVNAVSEEYVYYSDFGAKGDGVTDDAAAIKAAHDYANANNLPVKGDANATYYIGADGFNTITIKTSTDWCGAKFIIDDRAINTTSHAARNKNLFSVVPSLAAVSIKPSDIGSLSKGATNLGYAPGVDCLVHIENSNVKRYIRHGNNANSGSNQQEILLVRADGTISASTPPLWDYDTITSVWAVPVDETPITIENGTFETLANEINPDKYISVDRGMMITRSNTTVQNVKHTVTQVQGYRAAYSGFFYAKNCNAVLFYNCEIFCHKDSYFIMEGGAKNLLGSYELGANNANNIVYDKVIQTNFFDVENEVEHNQGLMGTNYCKNMYVTNSMFARFDAHCQVYNLTVKNSDLQRVNTIGFGTVKIENTNFWGEYMVDLRSDYGGFFDGDFYIKNVTMKEKSADRISIFSGNWDNHFFGYTVVKPQNIYIENLKVEKNKTIYLYTAGLDNKPDLTAATVSGAANLNPIVPTKLVKVISNPDNTIFKINPGPTFEGTKLELPESSGENAVEYLINCAFSENFTTNSSGFITGHSLAVGGYGSIKLQTKANGHGPLNLKSTTNGGNQALLFVGSGNPNNASSGTNICVDLLPSTDGSNTEYDTYQKYKGKSFVVAYDIKPISYDSANTEHVSLFTFSNFYSTSAGFVHNGRLRMRASDFSLYFTPTTGGSIELNTKLEPGRYYTIAMHVNVLENKFDLYLDDVKVLGDLDFLSSDEIGKIGTYDTDGSTIISSAKSNKMEDFLFSYARLARINGWKTTEGLDLYEVDNAKLYFSDTYLGTGDLNNYSAPANKYQEPNAGLVSGIINTNGGSLNHYMDYTSVYKNGTATRWEDGNNGDETTAKTIITIYDGADGAAGTVIDNTKANGYTLVVNDTSYTGSELKNATNIFKNVKDPVTGTDATAVKKYYASSKMINAGLVNGVDFWVTKDGNTFTVVSEDTPGAIRAQVTGVDDNNNGNLQRLNGVMDIINGKAIVSITFRWAGNTVIERLIEPCHGSGVSGSFNGSYRISIGASGNLYANQGKITLAKLSSDRYYNVTAAYYALKDNGADTYSMYYDVYLDGICVLKAEPIANVANKTQAQLSSGDTGMFGLRYFANAAINPNDNSKDTCEYVDALYIKSLYEYRVANTYVNTNVQNSGNTVEGYDLTLGSKLELNYYMNLLPDAIADTTAEVIFKIGGETVATKKISEVTPGANGLYKFTCPVNSVQMASNIEVTIKGEDVTYKFYSGGARDTKHVYSVERYAESILYNNDAKYDAAKPVVKAMVNYGAYAQTYFAAKNKTDAGTLPNGSCAYLPSELNEADFGTGTVTGAQAGMTATLVLDTDTKIRIYKDGALVAESEGITADNLNENVTVGGVTVSVLTIAGKVPESNTAFKNLAKALALYSAATEAYVESLEQ